MTIPAPSQSLRLAVALFAFVFIPGSCRMPDSIEIGSGYTDHPFWRRGGIGDQLHTNVNAVWHLSPRKVALDPSDIRLMAAVFAAEIARAAE